jgi:hypothetical protein
MKGNAVAKTDDLLNDPALEGMSNDEKKNLLDNRVAGLRSTLAGVMLDGATVQYSVDIPSDQRAARKEMLAKQEQALRGTLGALRTLRATVPDDPAPADDTPPTP